MREEGDMINRYLVDDLVSMSGLEDCQSEY